jgi:putative MATE family efflux protein
MAEPRESAHADHNAGRVSGASPALLAQNPLRAVVSLALPTTVVMFIAATSNVLHTFFVSRLGDESIASVSLVFPISLVIITVISGGLGAGVASGVARALGAGRKDEACAVAEHALVLTWVGAVVFTIGFELGSRALFRAMGGSGEILRQATLFARTLFAGLAIPFFVGTMDSIMRGEGNVRIPAACATLSLGLQIVLTPLFMFVAGMGLIGAPLATIVGQLIGALPRARYVFGGSGAIRPRAWPRRLARRHFAEILRVSVPSSLAATLNHAALIVLTGTFAHMGSHHLAAYGLATRLDFLLFSLGYGVALATLTLVGMATGAGRSDLVRQYVLRTVLLVTSLVAVPIMLVVYEPRLWLGIFTDDAEIQRVGSEYFRIVGPTYLFAVTSMTLASTFQGLGRATIPLAVMVGRVILLIGIAIVLTRVLGYGERPVFLLVAAVNVTSCSLLTMLFLRTVRGLRRSSATAEAATHVA